MYISALYQDILQGKFKEASEFERIQEFRTLVQHLGKKIVIDGRLAYNPVSLKISLPEDKKIFLERIEKTIANFTDEDEVALRNHRNQFDTV